MTVRLNRIARASGLSVVGLTLAFVSVVFIGGIAKAGPFSGLGTYTGYFDQHGGGSDSPYGRGPVIDNDNYAHWSIPSSVNDKNDLYNYLRHKYFHTGPYDDPKYPAWDRAGASFIVNTLLGRNYKQASRTVSDGMWADLKDRLDNPRVKFVNDNTVSASDYGGEDTFFQYPHKDVAYLKGDGESGVGIRLTYAGKTVYALIRKCANPVGNLGGLPQQKWKISVGVSADKSEVIPGQKITWTHTIKNTGPDATDDDITWRYESSGNINTTGGNHNFNSPKDKGDDASFTSSYTARNEDLGKKVCRSTWADPTAWNDDSSVETGQSCVNVVYKYGLDPIITVNGSGTAAPIESGVASISVAYSVNNSGPTVSKNTGWQVTRCRYLPPNAPGNLNGTTNGQSASATYGAGGTCNVLQAGNQVFTNGTNPIGSLNDGPFNDAAGTTICYILTVNPASNTDNSNKHSPLACVKIVKYPKIQAWGGDIKAGLIRTQPASVVDGKKYGSWAEYGIFNYGHTSGMGSASVFAGGCEPTPGNNCLDVTRLTFANTTGERFMEPTDEGYAAAYRDTTGTPFGGSFGVGNGTYTRNGDLDIGGSVPAGRTIVVTVTGNLRITSDIAYPDVYGSTGDIPRVIFVVDGDIRIDNTVGRIDAWLISKKTLYTCTDDSAPSRAPLTVSKCQNKLVFNGPVYVNDTRLSRTYGSDASNRDDAAEVFNLRPDVYVSSLRQSTAAGGIQTVYEKELPPRY